MQLQLVGNTHLVAGGAEAIPAVLMLLKQNGIETIANPDVYIREYSHFGIDEAREVRERALLRPAKEKRRYFVIATPNMTTEAQNALLKTLEEPPADALFIFITPAPQLLLPTLLSRMQMLSLDMPGTLTSSINIKKFLAAPAQKRLDMLRPILEKGQDDPEKPGGHGAGKRDMGAILTFLSSLESELAKNPEGLHALYRARKYIGDKGALVKPLLEHVALLV